MICRRLLGALIAAVLAVTLAPALAVAAPAAPSATPAASAATPATGVPLLARRDPSQDFPRMPRRCVDPEDLIPQRPVRCELNNFRRNRPTVVLWGDSHAWQLIPALRVAARHKSVNLVAFVMGSCPVMDNGLSKAQVRNAPACLRSNFRALHYVQRLKRGKERVRVVLGTYWQRYLRAIRVGDTTSYHGEMAARFRSAGPRLFRTLGKMRVGVDVVGQVVTVPARKPACPAGESPYACDLPRKKAIRDERPTKRYLKRQMRALAGRPGYVNVNASLCTRSTCVSRFDLDSGRVVYTYWDDQHISATLSRYLAGYFSRTIAAVKPGTKPTEPPPPPPPTDGGDGDGDGDADGGGGCTLIILC